MSRRRPLAAAVVTAAALLWPAAVGAQGTASSRETYGFAMPPSWMEVDRSSQQGVDMLTFVPQGQSLDQWQDMVILQIYDGMTALPAQALMERMLSNLKAACTDATASGLQTGLSNGYPSAFWATACAANKASGAGEVAYFRTLQGAENLYVVQRVWTLPPFDDETPVIPPAEKQEAIGILSALTVCAPGSAAHPCPGG